MSEACTDLLALAEYAQLEPDYHSPPKKKKKNNIDKAKESRPQRDFHQAFVTRVIKSLEGGMKVRHTEEVAQLAKSLFSEVRNDSYGRLHKIYQCFVKIVAENPSSFFHLIPEFNKFQSTNQFVVIPLLLKKTLLDLYCGLSVSLESHYEGMVSVTFQKYFPSHCHAFFNFVETHMLDRVLVASGLTAVLDAMCGESDQLYVQALVLGDICDRVTADIGESFHRDAYLSNSLGWTISTPIEDHPSIRDGLKVRSVRKSRSTTEEVPYIFGKAIIFSGHIIMYIYTTIYIYIIINNDQ
jgi:hypothetical protein